MKAADIRKTLIGRYVAIGQSKQLTFEGYKGNPWSRPYRAFIVDVGKYYVGREDGGFSTSSRYGVHQADWAKTSSHISPSPTMSASPRLTYAHPVRLLGAEA